MKIFVFFLLPRFCIYEMVKNVGKGISMCINFKANVSFSNGLCMSEQIKSIEWKRFVKAD